MLALVERDGPRTEKRSRPDCRSQTYRTPPLGAVAPMAASAFPSGLKARADRSEPLVLMVAGKELTRRPLAISQTVSTLSAGLLTSCEKQATRVASGLNAGLCT